MTLPYYSGPWLLCKGSGSRLSCFSESLNPRPHSSWYSIALSLLPKKTKAIFPITPQAQRKPCCASNTGSNGLGPDSYSDSFLMMPDKLGTRGKCLVKLLCGLYFYQLFKMTYSEEIQQLPILCKFWSSGLCVWVQPHTYFSSTGQRLWEFMCFMWYFTHLSSSFFPKYMIPACCLVFLLLDSLKEENDNDPPPKHIPTHTRSSQGVGSLLQAPT